MPRVIKGDLIIGRWVHPGVRGGNWEAIVEFWIENPMRKRRRGRWWLEEEVGDSKMVLLDWAVIGEREVRLVVIRRLSW